MSENEVRLRRWSPVADPAVLVAVRCVGLLHRADRVAVVRVNEDLVVLRADHTPTAMLADQVAELLRAGYGRGWRVEDG